MSQVFSDNMLNRHPKPVQEYERKLVSGTIYADWSSFAELEAVYDSVYRTNKYFWVNGVYYQCYGDGLYRAITSAGGNTGIVEYIADSDSDTIDVSELMGNTMYMVVQGSVPYTRYQVTQSGITLDFTGVGGVWTGQVILIFFK